LLISGGEAEQEALAQVARLMCLAARTAPKGGGVDNIVTAILTGADKDAVASEMRRIGEEQTMRAYLINAQDVDDSDLVVLIGTRLKRYGIKTCDYCGFEDCSANREAKGMCAIAVGDFGIAVGSAASVAGRHHADNRIMFTVGKAALNLGLLDEPIRLCYGIPLSAKGKNPYYDKDWKRAYDVEGWTAK
jgi:uncharacterized ferredoxin-like protein